MGNDHLIFQLSPHLRLDIFEIPAALEIASAISGLRAYY